jgi:alpha-L-fucosidase 2
MNGAPNYRRELNLAEAVARVSFRQNGVNYLREIFVSAPAQVIVIRLTADRSGSINFDANLERPERFVTIADERNSLRIGVQLHNGTDGQGMKYTARLRILNKNGGLPVKKITCASKKPMKR